MLIVNENLTENLKTIVEQNAKYQKVLLVFDASVSEIKLYNCYQIIKDFCVFNKMDIHNLSQSEINNGYKLIIFYCSANSFMQANLCVDDCVNVFVPTNENVLPFFLNFKNNNLKIAKFCPTCTKDKNYIFLLSGRVDVNIVFSVFFNKFYAYLKKLVFNEDLELNLNFDLKEITLAKTLDLLQENNLEFVDVEFLKKAGLDYSLLAVVDFLFLQAFNLVVNSVHERNLCFVDFFKSMKDDDKKIDKYFALANNRVFVELVNINFLCIKNVLSACLNKIDEIKSLLNFNLDDYNLVAEKLKFFCKEHDGLLNYLYLYNIFGE